MVGYWAVMLAIVYLIFKYFLPLVMPFFLAFLVSSLLKPAVRAVGAKVPIKRNVIALIFVLLFYIIITCLLVFLSARIIAGLSGLMQELPNMYSSTVQPGLKAMFERIEELSKNLSPDVTALLDTASEALLSSADNMITTVSSGVLTAISSLAAKLPRFVISTIVCIIATVFMAMDFPRITAFIMRQLPQKAQAFTLSVKNATVAVAVRYGRSYLLIMLMTFAELAIGLLIIGVRNAIPMAILIAVVDIFPVVGSGLFLWPWAALLFVQGHIGQGVGMVILYVVITAVRQFMEPKIVGGHVGLHPLVTLVCIFVGSRLFGWIGLFGLPILAAIVKNLDDSGVIHLFKKEAPETPAAPAGEKAPPDGGGDG